MATISASNLVAEGYMSRCRDVGVGELCEDLGQVVVVVVIAG